MATASIKRPLSLEVTLDLYLRSLAGRNRSVATITAYRADITQFISWMRATNATVDTPDDVERIDVTEYLGHLADHQLSDVSRARKLAAIREYFRFALTEGLLTVSPVDGIGTPKTEKRGRNYLTPEEYSHLLAAAGGSPRDFAILMTFLQTGLRVSELCVLVLDDVDFATKTLHVRVGKGMTARTVELEKKVPLLHTRVMHSAGSHDRRLSSAPPPIPRVGVFLSG